MLRYLGKVENIVKFQHFCGLQWDEIPTTDPSSQCGSSQRLYHNHVEDYISSYPNKSTEELPQEDNIDFERESTCHATDNTINGTVYSCNRVIHELFKFGSELGNELFYITFLPFVFWNVDDYIGRRLVILWVFNMYAGQGLKDVLCWPRPASPPVLRLEEIYASEYGMPSTHAVAGSIIPFGLVYFTYDRFQYKLAYGILFFLAWTSLVCMSRIYRGMHTFQDVVAGLSVAAFVTALWLPYLDLSLEIFLASPNAWIFIILVPILMIYAFPTRCMETRNDTIRIISVGCGCMLAAWTDYYIDQVPIPQPYKGAPRPVLPSGFVPWALFGASRFVIGICLVIPIKIVLKGIIHNGAAFMKLSNVKSTDRLANEFLTLPYLFITYTAIGYTAVYIAPKAFGMVGLIF